MLDLTCHAARVAIAAAIALAAGCGSSNSSTPAPADMTVATISYKPATVHQIDTDPGNGPYGNTVNVVIDNLVTVTKVDKYVNSSNQQCRYEIWVQDPLCTTPPCGMVAKAIGPMAPSATSTGKDCPSATLSGTPLNTVSKGDNVRLRGHLVFEIDSTAPMTVIEHQIFVDSLDILPTIQSITPRPITDPTMYGQFVAHSGFGWNTYEGMSLTLQPATGLLIVSVFNSNGFQTNPGSVNWGNTFDSDYYPNGVSTFPAMGNTYHAITGVVSTRHGGELMPTRNKDFVP